MNPSQKIADIQALRGVAILMVFIDHYIGRLPLIMPLVDGVRSYFMFGSGVDLFFAISGFVIMKSLFDRHEQIEHMKLDRSEFASFWKNRIYRLSPAAWFWALVGIGVASGSSPLFEKYDVLHAIEGAITAVLGVANVYWADCFSHLGEPLQQCGNQDINSYYWTLSLEEQFYLLASVIGLFLGYRFLAMIAVIGIVAQALHPRPFFGWFFFFRTDAICYGVLLYGFSRTRGYLRAGQWLCRWWVKAPLSMLAFLIMVTSLSAFSTTFIAPPTIGIALTGLMAGIIVLIASYDRGLLGGGFVKRIFVWIGERSYSIYLLHLPVLLLIGAIIVWFHFDWNNFGLWEDLITGIVAISTILVIANASYLFLEKPFMRRVRGNTPS